MFEFTSTQIIYIIFAFMISLLVSFASTPIASAIARKVGAVDKPNKRRINKVPIPRMGGMAIFFGFIVAVLCFAEMSAPEIRGILLGSVMIVVLGALDDVYQLPAIVKFVVQILVAVFVIWHGVDVTIVTNPFPGGSEYIHLGIWGYPLTALWIVGVTNAVNLIDGLDGLAVGTSAIACMALFIIALFTGEVNMALLLIAVIGACLGFLPYNSHPAKIFMGDTGSTFLGFIMATVSVQGLLKSYAVVTVAIPILILGLPIFDTSFAILRRIIKHQPVFAPDRGHLHHRLLDHGYNQKQAVHILYVISASLSLLAIVMLFVNSARAMIFLGAMLLLLFCAFVFAGGNIFKKEDKHEEEQKND